MVSTIWVHHHYPCDKSHKCRDPWLINPEIHQVSLSQRFKTVRKSFHVCFILVAIWHVRRSSPMKGALYLHTVCRNLNQKTTASLNALPLMKSIIHCLFRNSHASLRGFIEYENKRCITLLLSEMLHFQQKTPKDTSPHTANSKLIALYFQPLDNS